MEFEELKRVRTLSQLGFPRGREPACSLYLFPPFPSSIAHHPLYFVITISTPHLSCRRDQIKMRDYMNRRVTPPRRVTSLAWGSPRRDYKPRSEALHEK